MNETTKQSVAWNLALCAFTQGAWHGRVEPNRIPGIMKKAAEIFESRQCLEERFGDGGSIEVVIAVNNLTRCFGEDGLTTPEELVDLAFCHVRSLESSALLLPEDTKRSRAIELDREAVSERERVEAERLESERQKAENREAEREKELKDIERQREELNA